MHRRTLLAGAAAPAGGQPAPRAPATAAAISDGVVKIGVLDDMSGVFADQQGMGDYIAARMAAEDFGGHVLGAPMRSCRPTCRTRSMSAWGSPAPG